MMTLKQIASCRKIKHVCPHCGENTRTAAPTDLKDFIFRVTSRVTKVPVTDIKRPIRNKEIVFARQIAMTMLYQENMMSCLRVGNEFNKDHTTVLASMKRIQDLSDTDPDVKRCVDFIRRKIGERKAELVA